jgi:opacity protein-like surface antigen
MLNRNALMLVAGAAIFALDASAASAQDTTRTRPTSSRRIPITKEAPGEVARPVTVRVDTQMVYKTDTLRLPGRVDTVVTTNTITRIDTVQALPPVLAQIGGVYFGFAGGSSLPAANFNDSDKPGWRVEGMLGVDPIGSPLGLRLSGGYSRYAPHSYVARMLDNAAIMNAALDAKLRLVSISPLNRRIQLYAIGGGTYNRFKDILENYRGTLSIGESVGVNGALPTTADHDWHNGFGYNLGGGAELGWGRTNLFIESRFARFRGENSNISHVPVVIVLSWF